MPNIVSTLLSDVLADEIRLNERIVWQNDTWVVLVPFWAFWPFETLLISRRPVQFVHDLTDRERTGCQPRRSPLPPFVMIMFSRRVFRMAWGYIKRQ